MFSWMKSKKHKQNMADGLGVAFNEAALFGVELDEEKRRVGVTLSMVCANEDGTLPDDKRVQIILQPVGKLVASLRNGRWDDEKAEIVPFKADELLETIKSFQGLPIYGWEFINCGDNDYNQWSKRASLTFESGTDGLSHTFDLFQEGFERHLDLRIWFDDMKFFSPGGQEIEIEEVIKRGKRGWDQIYSGDKKATNEYAIFPTGKD